MLNIQLLAPWVAGATYGSWSAWVNSEFGPATSLIAFIIQGGFAFASTLGLACAVNWMRQKPLLCQPYKSFMATSLLLLLVPGSLHLIAGTPDIWQAMMPGLIIGNGYLWFLVRSQTGLAPSQ